MSIERARHLENLAKASREQIDLARIFQRAAFDDDKDASSRDEELRQMVMCPDTFIPAPLYLDLALKFSEQSWREALFAKLALMQ